MAETYIGSGYPETYIGTGTLSSTVSELRWVIIDTAPSDAPAAGTMRQYINEAGAAPYRRLYTYSASGWGYVEN